LNGSQIEAELVQAVLSRHVESRVSYDYVSFTFENEIEDECFDVSNVQAVGEEERAGFFVGWRVLFLK
jgi:hypothetical protein